MDAGHNGVGEKKGSGRPAVKIPADALDPVGPASSFKVSGETKRQGQEGTSPSALRQAESARFCDGLGAVAVAASYYASRNSRIQDDKPRLEVCFGCLGSGAAR